MYTNLEKNKLQVFNKKINLMTNIKHLFDKKFLLFNNL